MIGLGLVIGTGIQLAVSLAKSEAQKKAIRIGANIQRRAVETQFGVLNRNLESEIASSGFKREDGKLQAVNQLSQIKEEKLRDITAMAKQGQLQANVELFSGVASAGLNFLDKNIEFLDKKDSISSGNNQDKKGNILG